MRRNIATLLSILCIGARINRAGAFLHPASPAPRLFAIITNRQPTQTPIMRRSSTTLETPAAPAEKEEKITPEARELTQVLLEKEDGTSSYKYIVAQTAPSVRIAFSELFGKEPGAFNASLLVASLKALGFDLVLDTNIGADLTICEEGQELLERILAREESKTTGATADKPLPLFTSCCPGWMNLVEKSAPEMIPYISTCKSPHMMYGAVLKQFSRELMDCEPEEIYLCSVMPCVRKRGESDHAVFRRENGIRDVDNVITTRDLGFMLKTRGIDPLELESQQYDSPFQSETAKRSGLGSGAGQLFGVTGGVMEAAVRSVYELVTGDQMPRLEIDEVRGLDEVKEATVSLFNKETGKGLNIDLRVAVVNGLGNAKKLLAKMKTGEVVYDFVEVMACPGGCINGGGQPRGATDDTAQRRMDIIYALDKQLPIRRSHEHPVVKALYERHLGKEFGSPEAHDLLHVEQIYGGPDEAQEA